RGVVGVPPRQAGNRELHVRTDIGQQSRRRTPQGRQFTAAKEKHAIRALGKDAAGASKRPLLVARERCQIFWPSLLHLVGAGNVLFPNGARHGTKRSRCRRGLSLRWRVYQPAAPRDPDGQSHRQRQSYCDGFTHSIPPRTHAPAKLFDNTSPFFAGVAAASALYTGSRSL